MTIFDSLKSAFGFGPSTAPTQLARGRRPPSGVVAELPLYQQLQRLGGSLTPQQVGEIIRQADTGYMYRLIDLANEARQKDGHLQAVLQTRETALTGLEWTISPHVAAGTKVPRKRDKKIALFCEDVLRRIDLLPMLFSHLSSANYYGYAVAETLWKKVDGQIVPYAFDRMSPRRFIFDIAKGKLRWCDINAGMAYPGIDLQETYPGQFIQFQPRVNGDVPVREGLVRVLMWAALFRNWTMRDWLQLAELAWKPWRTGKYEKSASQEDIDNLEAVLDGMSGSGVAVYPGTTEVHIEWPKNSTSGTSAHGELFGVVGAEMSKAVLGQTLTTEQGKVGSQALGRVHDNVRRDILQADARAIASILVRDLLTPMVHWNFGPDEAVPTFRFVTEDATDLTAFSTSIFTLRRAGLRIPAAYVRQVAGIPDPVEDEELVGEDDEADDDDAGGGGSGGDGGEPDPEEGPSPDEPAAPTDEPDEPPGEKAATRAARSRRRRHFLPCT